MAHFLCQFVHAIGACGLEAFQIDDQPRGQTTTGPGALWPQSAVYPFLGLQRDRDAHGRRASLPSHQWRYWPMRGEMVLPTGWNCTYLNDDQDPCVEIEETDFDPMPGPYSEDSIDNGLPRTLDKIECDRCVEHPFGDPGTFRADRCIITFEGGDAIHIMECFTPFEGCKAFNFTFGLVRNRPLVINTVRHLSLELPLMGIDVDSGDQFCGGYWEEPRLVYQGAQFSTDFDAHPTLDARAGELTCKNAVMQFMQDDTADNHGGSSITGLDRMDMHCNPLVPGSGSQPFHPSQFCRWFNLSVNPIGCSEFPAVIDFGPNSTSGLTLRTRSGCTLEAELCLHEATVEMQLLFGLVGDSIFPWVRFEFAAKLALRKRIVGGPCFHDLTGSDPVEVVLLGDDECGFGVDSDRVSNIQGDELIAEDADGNRFAIPPEVSWRGERHELTTSKPTDVSQSELNDWPSNAEGHCCEVQDAIREESPNGYEVQARDTRLERPKGIDGPNPQLRIGSIAFNWNQNFETGLCTPS